MDDVINEKLDKTTIKDDLGIMTINVLNNGKQANAVSRREHLLSLVSNVYPEILLLQECNGQDIAKINTMLKKKNMSEYKYEIETKDTAILVKSKSLTKIEKKNFTTFKQLSETLVNINLPSNRLLLAETLFHEKEIIIGSWHGPHTGRKDDIKLDTVKQIIAFMNSMNKPWIVGGDFNINHKKVLEFLESTKSNVNISPITKEEIIYFMFSNSIIINNVSTDEKGHDSSGRVCFDHYPLKARITFKKQE